MSKSRKLTGWQSIESGVKLVSWSKLAHWSGQELIADNDLCSFDQHWKNVDPKYGRWFCWLAFGVGAESILMGAFDVKGLKPAKFAGDHAWRKLGLSEEDAAVVNDSIKHLAANVRNRDAHEYIADVRDANFSEAEERFVPTLNRVLQCLKADGLEQQLRDCVKADPVPEPL